jgi:hypothetical protein
LSSDVSGPSFFERPECVKKALYSTGDKTFIENRSAHFPRPRAERMAHRLLPLALRG